MTEREYWRQKTAAYREAKPETVRAIARASYARNAERINAERRARRAARYSEGSA